MSATRAASDAPFLSQQVLVCRLRKQTAGRAADLPTAGELELENVSQGVVEIAVHTSPLQYLDLIVTDSRGQVLSESYYGDLFSPLEEPCTLRLQPGQKYSGPVGLLGNVPEAKQVPGVYTVQAVYEYETLRTVSKPLQVELKPRPDASGAQGLAPSDASSHTGASDGPAG